MLNEALKRTLLLCATLLWLLHSVVPHAHHNQENGISALGQGAPNTFLELLFSPDLGEDHLEHASAEERSLMLIAVLATEPGMVCSLYTSGRTAPALTHPEQSLFGHEFTRLQRGPPSA